MINRLIISFLALSIIASIPFFSQAEQLNKAEPVLRSLSEAEAALIIQEAIQARKAAFEFMRKKIEEIHAIQSKYSSWWYGNQKYYVYVGSLRDEIDQECEKLRTMVDALYSGKMMVTPKMYREARTLAEKMEQQIVDLRLFSADIFNNLELPMEYL